MQATIKFRKPDSSGTGSRGGPSFNPQGPSPVSMHVIKQTYIGISMRITVELVVRPRARNGTFGRLVRSNAAAVPCEDRP